MQISFAPRRILCLQFDDLPSLSRPRFEEPILRILDWFEAPRPIEVKTPVH